MTETVTIVEQTPNPTLEESAAKAGIDPSKIDATATSQSAESRPTWLPEKFQTPEDMAKSYAELEKKLGKPKEEETPAERTEQTAEPSTEETPEENPPEQEAEEVAKEVVSKAGLDMDKLSEKFWSTGKIDDSDYEALEKVGVSKALVDQFAAGQVAILEATRQTVFAEAGGEQAFEDLKSWGRDNYSEAEINEFNEAVNGNDASKRLSAVKALKARHAASEGFEPAKTVEGKTSKVASDVYESVAQLQKDIGDSRYKSDPAFRAKVEAKLSRSDIM